MGGDAPWRGGVPWCELHSTRFHKAPNAIVGLLFLIFAHIKNHDYTGNVLKCRQLFFRNKVCSRNCCQIGNVTLFILSRPLIFIHLHDLAHIKQAEAFGCESSINVTFRYLQALLLLLLLLYSYYSELVCTLLSLASLLNQAFSFFNVHHIFCFCLIPHL